MSKEKKTIKTDFENEDGRIKLRVTGKNAINQSYKIIQTFDNACKEFNEKEDGSN